MKKFLISYSHSNGISSGFGNVYRQHPDDSSMTESDVREVTEWITENTHPGGEVVVLGFYEVES